MNEQLYTTLIIILVVVLYIAFTRYAVTFLEKRNIVDFREYPLMGNVVGLLLALSIYGLYLVIRLVSSLFFTD